MTRFALAGVLVVVACAKGGRSKEAAPASAEPPQAPPATQSATPAPAADPASAKEEARAQGLLGPTDHDLFTDLEGEDKGKATEGGAQRTGAAADGPRVSIGRAAVTAKVELRVLQDALAKRTGEIEACYDRALATSKGIAGELSIAFTVKPDGSVADLSVKRSTVKHAELGACVVAALSTIKLDKPLGKAAVTGSVPITFRPR